MVGDAFIDIIARARAVKGGETHHTKIITSCGGTANVAIQVSRLGETARFIGKVGSDVFGKFFKQNLRKNLVEDLTFTDYRNPTGLCVSLAYKDGERALIADRGANDHLTKEDIERHIHKIGDSSIIYFSGYSFMSDRTKESILYATATSREECEVWFNPGAPNIIQADFKDYIKEYVNVLVLNLAEAKAIIGERNVKEIMDGLRELVALSVVTLGRDGCLVSSGEGYVHVPTEKLQVKDTTGAGDAFAAGFAVGKIGGIDLVGCARLGNGRALDFLKQKVEM